jgi:hypothetical protein
MRLLFIATIMLATWCGSSQFAGAQNASPDLKLASVVSQQLSLGSTAIVQVDGLNAIAAGTPKLTDFVLYLDHYPVADGADLQLSNIAANRLAFSLQRTATQRHGRRCSAARQASTRSSRSTSASKAKMAFCR